MKRRGKILGASLGTCVHVAGIQRFLRMCEEEGYETHFLGPAISPEELVGAIMKHKPEIVAVSYRLTPEVAERLFQELKALLAARGSLDLHFVFGGTPPVAEVAKRAGLFERVFSGLEPIEEVRAYIRGARPERKEEAFPPDLVGRIKWHYPYPLLRHHFGRPTLAETIEGAKRIAEARVLDVLSIGPDQNAQASFFQPQEMDPVADGAGGVPLRKPEDLEAIYQATRCGNFPLVRCYSGTRDLLKWAEMSLRTIRNAWAAIPLCWYSVLDGRSDRGLVEAITENQQVIRWYAEKGIPVEVNESHQWSLRDAHDSLAVAMAFLAAYNAKKLGVRHYVAQYMLNTPPGTSPAMDLAKMLAKLELSEGLQDERFAAFRQGRAGLASMPPDFALAKGHLAASTVIGLALEPHILHVVGYSESHHAITAEELIESCKIAHGAIRNARLGLPGFSHDPAVQERRAELVSEAVVLLEGIKDLGSATSDDPWTDPKVIASAIARGLLDAPHFAGHRYAHGAVVTRIINGACYAVEPKSGRILTEAERLGRIRIGRGCPEWRGS